MLSTAGGDAAAFGGIQARMVGEAAVIAQRVKDQSDVDSVFRAETALKTDYLEFEREELNKQGANAAGAAERTKGWWEKAASTYGADLSPEARRAFEQRASQVRLTGTETLMRHAQTQANRSLVESSNATAQTSANLAEADPSPDRVLKARTDIVTAVNAAGKVLGWDEKQRAKATLELTSPMHTTIIENLAVKDAAAARKWYKDNKDEITSKDYAKIEKHLDTAGLAEKSQVEAVKIVSQYGPGQTAEAQKAIDALDVTAEEKKAIRTEVEHRHAILQADINQVNAASTGKIMAAYASGASLAQLKKMPEWGGLVDGGAAITEKITDRQHALAVRGDEDRARALRNLTLREFGSYLDYSDPVKINAMSRDSIKALLPKLGPTLTENLLQKKDAFVKSDATYREATIDKQMFDSLAQRAGLRPFESNKSEDEKAALGELQSRVEMRIAAEQGAKNRLLSRPEKEALFQQEIDNKVLVDSRFWGGPTEKPAYAVTRSEQSRVLGPAKAGSAATAPVKTSEGRAPIAIISGAERAQIKEKLTRDGVPLTEDNYQRTYHMLHGKTGAF
jgi:hypothetical protein